MTHFRLLLASALVVTSGTFIGALQQPTRDQPVAGQRGSSSISGIVTSDEPQPRPLRRARVVLRGGDPLGSAVITNDDGTFAFEGLPAGRYAVSAVKDGYVTANYGAPWQGGQGRRISLRDGEVRKISIRLPRGAVITGTIADAFGQPAAGVTVYALMWQYITASGERRLVPSGRSAGVTDDRGQYRIYGLAAGEYYVSAHDDRQFANRGLLMAMRTELQPVASVPISYPGVPSIDGATRIALAAGEERTAVNFAMQYVPASSVSGTIAVDADGRNPTGVMLVQANRLSTMVVRGSGMGTGPIGEFEFGGLPPGSYTLLATAGTPAKMLAMTEVTIEGQDISNVQLTPQPSPRISGRIVFEGRRSPPRLMPTSQNLPLRFSLWEASLSFNPWGGSPSPSLQIADDGRFSLTEFLPGVHVLTDPSRGIRAPISGWWIASVASDGRELLDAPLELRNIENVIVTMSDRASELGGVVKDAQGSPGPEQFVVAFSSERDALVSQLATSRWSPYG